jgi:hypothetical protein
MDSVPELEDEAAAVETRAGSRFLMDKYSRRIRDGLLVTLHVKNYSGPVGIILPIYYN